jgi:AcrR family transcriptional regulator
VAASHFGPVAVPKIVDHEERREEVIAAVWRVIARDGLDASTIRAIAKETGASAGVLAHYFKDKDDILTQALKLSHKRIRARQERKLAGLVGVAALKELVRDNLPLDEERDLETRLEISYWARSLTRAEVAKVQRAEASILYDRMKSLIVEAQKRGEVDKDERPETIAERLLALIDGISLHALIHPARVSTKLQLATIEREFEQLQGPGRR